MRKLLIRNISLFLICLTLTETSFSAWIWNQGPRQIEKSDSDLLGSIESFKSTSFIQPNELQPSKMLPLTSTLSQGTLIAVGTERGFISAAINRQFNKVFLIDRDPQVVLYNRINIKFLKMAENFKDYQWLRSEAKYKDLVERFKNDLTLSRAEMDWLVKWREDDLLMRNIFIENSANYVQNEELCLRLMDLAKNGKLQSHLVDITDLKEVKLFSKKYLAPHSVTGIDLSNTWWDNYVGLQNIRNFASLLLPKVLPSATVVLTHFENGDSPRWNYFGLSVQYMMTRLGWQNILKLLKESEAMHYSHSFPFYEAHGKIDFGKTRFFCRETLIGL